MNVDEMRNTKQCNVSIGTKDGRRIVGRLVGEPRGLYVVETKDEVIEVRKALVHDYIQWAIGEPFPRF